MEVGIPAIPVGDLGEGVGGEGLLYNRKYNLERK